MDKFIQQMVDDRLSGLERRITELETNVEALIGLTVELAYRCSAVIGCLQGAVFPALKIDLQVDTVAARVKEGLLDQMNEGKRP